MGADWKRQSTELIRMILPFQRRVRSYHSVAMTSEDVGLLSVDVHYNVIWIDCRIDCGGNRMLGVMMENVDGTTDPPTI